MEVLILLTLLIALDLAAWRWGPDSRDGPVRGPDERNSRSGLDFGY